MNKQAHAMHPVHPGELLREILEELDISAYALAKSIEKAPIQVSRILAGKSSITAPMARLIGASLGTTAKYWVNLQAHYDLEVAKQITPVLTVKPLVTNDEREHPQGMSPHYPNISVDSGSGPVKKGSL